MLKYDDVAFRPRHSPVPAGLLAALVMLSWGCTKYTVAPQDGGSDLLTDGQVSDGKPDVPSDVFDTAPDHDDGRVADAGRDAAPEVEPDGGPSCSSSTHLCSGSCVANNSTDHCGLSCDRCLPPSGGTPTCDGAQCGFDCGGLKKCNSKCVAGCCMDGDCPAQNGKVGQCDTSTNTCSYLNCAVGFKPCGTLCIGTDKCCAANDCTGVCMTCSGPGGACVSVKSQDDSDSCPGTCDATGACKSKQGQSCQATTGGCVSGTVCAPDGICCDRACTNSCEACDIGGFVGTCTLVASGPPHGNRTSCGTDTTCKGQCGGRATPCAHTRWNVRNGGIVLRCQCCRPGTCSGGACITAAAHPCSGGFVCSGNACKIACSADADCLPDYFCHAGLCHRDAKAVAVSYDHACVLLVDGTVRCWGTLVPTSSSTPIAIAGLAGVSKIGISGDYNLALLSDGTVRYWGSAATDIHTISTITIPPQSPILVLPPASQPAPWSIARSSLIEPSSVGGGKHTVRWGTMIRRCFSP